MTGRCLVQDAGHCFTITETTQTFAKMLTVGRLKQYFLGLMLALVKFWVVSAMVKQSKKYCLSLPTVSIFAKVWVVSVIVKQ